ncbi:MAG: peptidylprolyl isomerase [Pseudohongiellaceae bacterium]
MSRQTRPITSAILLLVTWLATAAALAQTTQAPQREVLDRVIAIVDEGVILQSEMAERMQQARERARQNEQQLPPEEALREQIMESLIVENLQLQWAERVGIRIDDDTLNSVMADIADRNNMTFDQYVNALQSAGQYENTREQIRRELAINEVQRGMVNRRISITEQEIENYLNSEQGRASMEPDYLVDQLLVPITGSDSEQAVEARRQHAQSLYERIQDGEPFADVRMSTQQSGNDIQVSASQLGWRKREELPTLFAEVVPDMTLGEAHEPLRSANGFHVLYLRDVRGDSNRMVDQVRARHILISPSEIRTETQAQRLAEDLYEQIQDGESFSSLARQYSDDSQSVVAGGDMGWASEGGMPPQFEARIRDLPAGEVTEPFRTDFGWHIAEVLDRRERDLSQQYRRQLAENALRQRKFELELENWLSELRDEAYVEML